MMNYINLTKLRLSLELILLISPKMTIAQLLSLLAVSQNENQDLRYYQRDTGHIKGTISRHFLEMGQPTSKYFKALNLIKGKVKETDKRLKTYCLTERGVKLVKALLGE